MLRLYNSGYILQGHYHPITGTNNPPSTDSETITPTPTDPDIEFPTPPLRPVDTPIPSIPQRVSFTHDQLRKGFGFRNIDNIIKHLKDTCHDNFSISTHDQEPTIDLGRTATIERPKRNTQPNPLPKHFGNTIHMDIIFGSRVAIRGVKYGLFLIDKATRQKYIYPLRDLKDDILTQIQQFCADIGFVPRRFISDCDNKLMGKAIREWLSKQNSIVHHAPGGRQSMNGLCERHWRTIVKMARGWIASHQLPSTFWWHALRRATEVSNYIPLKINNTITTSHELTYRTKPDLRTILPIFSVCYIRKLLDKSHKIVNIQPHSIRAILIGRSSQSNCHLFYHPPTKRTFRSDDFVIDETRASGPTFSLNFDGGLFFNSYEECNTYFKAPQYAPEDYVYIKTSTPATKAQIITIPENGSDIYTLKLPDGSLKQYQERCLSDHDPNISITDNNPPTKSFPSWIKHNCSATLFTKNMPKPLQGSLLQIDSTSVMTPNIREWVFQPGTRNTNKNITLTDFTSKAHTLISTHQLFEGHPRHSKLYQLRNNMALSNIVSRYIDSSGVHSNELAEFLKSQPLHTKQSTNTHVSAAGLSTTDVPTLPKHKNLNPNDKAIWDSAYAEEYDGLANLPAWITITESQYQKIKHKCGTLLPTMAISTIKYDENRKPKRAKYRIVALGNLDPHEWTKSDVYAPVMSLLEVRLLASMAVRDQCVLQAGDVKQAFVQSKLPKDEVYVLRPPAGCPKTPPNSYWLLKRSLYGLKRAPRHWFQK